MKWLFQTEDSWAELILRLILGIVFFAHGSQKMLGLFGGYGFSASVNYFTTQMHIPTPVVYLIIFTEFFGALGLIVGLLTRLAALGIGFEMFVAVLMVHIHFGFFMNWTGAQKGEGFEYHLLLLAICAALIIRGGGKWSIDKMISG